MKICWDMLEGLYLTRNASFAKGSETYVYKDFCAKCGEPYLAIKSRQSKFCSQSCSVGGKNNPNYGKTQRMGVLSPNYKGGVTKAGLITYDTCKDRLGFYEEVRKQKGTKILEVKCAYCGRWYAPKWFEVRNRLKAINNLNQGEMRFYCSENCKLACPTYGQKMYPKGFKHTTSREVNPYLRQMVLERDNWTCQICGKTIAEIQLHVHHMDPVAQNPMFQNDMDSCITLCKECHAMVHSRRGCRYVDLQCKTETDYTKKIKKGEGLKV
jgi:5-methylcytosine-specific restriction endonuclease McrA